MPKNTSACGEVCRGTWAMFWNIAHVQDLTYLITNLAFWLDCRPRNVFVIFRINPHKNNPHNWLFTLFFKQKWQRFTGPHLSNVSTFIFVCHSLSYVTVNRISLTFCRQTNYIQDHPKCFFSGLKIKMKNSPSNGISEAVVSTSFHHTRSSCTGALIGQISCWADYACTW